MKKIVNVSLLILIISYTALSQIIKDRTKLKGAPKSAEVEVTRVSQKAGNIAESARVPTANYFFDSNGNLTESTIYNYDGSFYTKYVATFDDNGKKKEEAYYSSKGKLVDKMAYNYDASGRVSEKVIEKGKTSPQRTTSLKYDNDGRIIEKISNPVKDRPQSKVGYSYDESNRKIEQRAYDANGDVIGTTTTTFDGQGRLFRIVNQFTKPFSGSWRMELAYDSNGNVSEEKFYVLDGVSAWRYEYELDQNGNWIKRTKLSIENNSGSVESKPIEITYRRITYHQITESPHKDYSVSLAAIVAEDEMSSHLSGEPIKSPEPGYPEQAKQARMAGRIGIVAMADEKGEVVSVRASRPNYEPLRNAAESAAWQWKFTPVVSGGYGVRTVITFRFNFNF